MASTALIHCHCASDMISALWTEVLLQSENIGGGVNIIAIPDSGLKPSLLGGGPFGLMIELSYVEEWNTAFWL